MSPLTVVARGLVAIVFVGAALAIAAAAAPATWIDPLAAAATGGRLRMAEAEGTLWRGSARVVWADTGESAESRVSLAGLALPGRIHWRLAPLPLLVGLIDANVQIDGMPQAVALQGSPSGLRIGNGKLELPRMDLGALGSPWNTVRPAGAVALSWSNIALGPRSFEGSLNIELRAVASALSPVRPLGSYRIEVLGRGTAADLRMSTLEGALNLSGNGTVGASGFAFTARASPAKPDERRLQGLLGLIGQRDGNASVIRIGS